MFQPFNYLANLPLQIWPLSAAWWRRRRLRWRRCRRWSARARTWSATGSAPTTPIRSVRRPRRRFRQVRESLSGSIRIQNCTCRLNKMGYKIVDVTRWNGELSIGTSCRKEVWSKTKQNIKKKYFSAKALEKSSNASYFLVSTTFSWILRQK